MVAIVLDLATWKPSDAIAATAALIALASLLVTGMSLWIAAIALRRSTPRPSWKAGWAEDPLTGSPIFRARNIGEGHARDVGFAASVYRDGRPIRGDGHLSFSDLGPGETYEFRVVREFDAAPLLVVEPDETAIAAMIWHEPPHPQRSRVTMYFLGKPPRPLERSRAKRRFRRLGGI